MESTPPIASTPKFAFGINGNMRNCIFFLDDQRVIYPCGHNVIILTIGDDKTQEYIPCIEGSEGITAMALSYNKAYLAVWERSEKALCSIYSFDNKKRRKIICSDNLNDREFISVAFSHQNEKNHLVTLTGGQDGMVILWQWKKSKCIAYQKVGISEGQTLYDVSFSIQDFNSLIVTGNGVYKYFKLKDNGLRPEHSGLNQKREYHFSNHFTCHTWLPDGKAIVCTDQGELLLLESTGELKMFLSWSPGDGFYIESITTYSKGFMIAGDTGQIMVYEKTDEPKKPFAYVATWPNEDPKKEKKYSELLLSIMASRIKCIALSSNDDTLVFSTENNQLMKVNVNLEKSSESSIKYEYLIYPFHSKAITGLDVCIKKHLVATCSADKTVRIWNYGGQTPKLEICETFQEEANSVAFHPSGYHIVVGFTDKIRMMNVFSEKKLSTFKEILIKSCREIQFSNGGHLFACTNSDIIQVYNFYTGENLPTMIFHEHESKVRCISWAEDDSYFASAGWDGKIYVWNIKSNTKPEYSFESKGTNFTSVAKMPHHNTLYAVSSDRMIRELSYKVKEDKNDASVAAHISTDKKETEFPIEAREVLRFDANPTKFSQVVLLNGGRGMIVGTADESRPGMIMIFRPDMERAWDIQAHSQPVERLKLSFDNQTLFSAGQDGTFFIFNLEDPLFKSQKEPPQIQPSEEILWEKAELRELLQAIEHLKRENDSLTQLKETEKKRIEAVNNEQIEKLKEDRDKAKEAAKAKQKQLVDEIAELEARYKDQIEKKNLSNQDELERREKDFQEKKQQDMLRYKELEQKMKEEEEKIEAQINRLHLEHEEALEKLKLDNEKEIRKMKDRAAELMEQKMSMEKENKTTRDELENMYWEEIDEMKEKNKNELYKQTKLGLDAKSELTTISAKCTEAKTDKEGKEQEIKENEEKLNNEIQNQRALKSEIENQINEIAERKRTIADKETRIFQLKKKTQELEKFKFVLDYKIKELKRDINPKEAEINKLNEQTTKMDQELKHFTRVNENLALIVDDLRMRQEGLQKEVEGQNKKIESQQKYVKKFNDDLFDWVNNLSNKKALKKDIINLHKKYILEEASSSKGSKMEGEADIQKKYAAKRKYLEKSVNYLRIMIAKDSSNHKQEYTRYMKENVTLLQEINDLRKEVKTLEATFKSQKKRQKDTMGSRFSARDEIGGSQHGNMDPETVKELNMQDNILQNLTRELAEIKEDNDNLQTRARSSRGARNLAPIPRPEDNKEEDPVINESEKRLDDFRDEEEAQR